jgi:four helix bundle protein
MGDYRDLVAWREAMSLVEAVYRDTEGFPRDEMFGLKAQIRRSAVSVPSNIPEGSGRHATGELR